MAFSNDLALVVVGRTEEEVQGAGQAVELAREWLINTMLELAAQRTQVVELAGRRILTNIRITVGDLEVEPTTKVKYL